MECWKQISMLTLRPFRYYVSEKSPPLKIDGILSVYGIHIYQPTDVLVISKDSNIITAVCMHA